MKTGRNDFTKSLQVEKPLMGRNRNGNSLGERKRNGTKTLKTEHEIDEMMQKMAKDIYETYKGKPLALICVDHGAKDMYNLLYDNLLTLGLELYEGHVRTIKDATHTEKEKEVPEYLYRAGIASDKNSSELAEMDAVIFDDQVVSGKTAALLIDDFSNRAKSVEFATAVLTGNQYKENEQLEGIRFIGMRNRKKVAGYRMDHKGKYREVRAIIQIPDEKGKGKTKRKSENER